MKRSSDETAHIDAACETNTKKTKEKRKKKRNLWPLKALLISFALAAVVNVGSELILTGTKLWISIVITVIIVLIGVFFDIIGTATTSCDIQPFLAMASRKVKGAKTAVKLAKKADAVSSVCNDIVGDICGIVSGGCASTIVLAILSATTTLSPDKMNLWLSVLVYTIISTLTISLKAVGKGYAVKNANKIVFATAKTLCLFNKKG
jgi:CBS domain containing-hemolysin-like protein